MPDTANILDAKASKRTWRCDGLMAAAFAWEFRENNLTHRVAAAREMGVSYGQYMAMLKDGLIEDPLAGGARNA